MATATRSARTPYDPGTAGTIRFCGHDEAEVQSFRDRGTFYLVNLRALRCSCPDSTKRDRACKHVDAALAESTRRALRAASSLTILELRRHLSRPDLRPEVKCAIACMIERRTERMIDEEAA